MISVSPYLFVQMANFILLILILNVILYKPIRNIINERKKKIQGLEESIDASQRGADETEEIFQTKMSEAKMKGVQEKETLEQAGLEEERRLIDEINRKALEDLAAIRAQIGKDAEDAKRKLEAETKAFSASITEKILGRALS